MGCEIAPLGQHRQDLPGRELRNFVPEPCLAADPGGTLGDCELNDLRAKASKLAQNPTQNSAVHVAEASRETDYDTNVHDRIMMMANSH